MYYKNNTIFQSELSMSRFISENCRFAMYCYLKCMSQIRNIDSTEFLLQAQAISRIDYVNSILISANKTSLHRVQVMQNSAATLIQRTPLLEYITPIRKQLYWLQIEYGIEY